MEPGSDPRLSLPTCTYTDALWECRDVCAFPWKGEDEPGVHCRPLIFSISRPSGHSELFESPPWLSCGSERVDERVYGRVRLVDRAKERLEKTMTSLLALCSSISMWAILYQELAHLSYS